MSNIVCKWPKQFENMMDVLCHRDLSRQRKKPFIADTYNKTPCIYEQDLYSHLKWEKHEKARPMVFMAEVLDNWETVTMLSFIYKRFKITPWVDKSENFS